MNALRGVTIILGGFAILCMGANIHDPFGGLFLVASGALLSLAGISGWAACIKSGR
jgi:hypothetical protein